MKPSTQPRTVAVIDVGSTSVRMDIAEIGGSGSVKKLQSSYQAVNLGKDVFTKGHIENTTTRECIEALKSFQKLIGEYAISPTAVHAVATSAVREASNQDNFLDRVLSATGFDVDVLEESEVNRYSFLSIWPLLGQAPFTGRSTSFLIEAGSGSTELLIIRHGRVTLSSSFRLGSFRLREMLEEFKDSPTHVKEFVGNQTERAVGLIRRHVGEDAQLQMIAAGGDARFAASHIMAHKSLGALETFNTVKLSKFTDSILNVSVDELVRRFRLSYPDAETLAPALVIHTHIAEALGLKKIHVTSVSMRDGLLQEMAGANPWSKDTREQILHSAEAMGRKYGFDAPHARQVMALSGMLFSALHDLHRLDPKFELLLQVAATLHDIGLFVSSSNHHKHSMYLILNSEIFGLNSSDIRLVALTARYHRRALPAAVHDLYGDLPRSERMAVAKMAALLRLADALDRRHSQCIRRLEPRVEGDRVMLGVKGPADMTVESLAVKRKGDLFEQVFGLEPRLVREGAPLR